MVFSINILLLEKKYYTYLLENDVTIENVARDAEIHDYICDEEEENGQI